MKTTLEISPKIAEFINTDAPHLAAMLERFASLLREAMKTNEDAFTAGEWCLMAAAAGEARFDPQLGPVDTLAGRVEHEARLAGLDTWYKVDLKELLRKVRALDIVRGWAVVEALASAQTPGMDADHEAWWTLAYRKQVLSGGHNPGTVRRSSASKSRAKTPAGTPASAVQDTQKAASQLLVTKSTTNDQVSES